MKILRAIIPLLVLCLPGLADVATSASSEPGMPQFSPQNPPRPAPDFQVATRDGKPIHLADLKGRPVLINLWATWCGPCIAEMPSLDRLAAERAGTPLAVMAVSEDRKGEAAVGPFVDSHDVGKLPIFLDPKSEVAHAFGIEAIPTTILIDRQGREVGRLLGPAAWDGPAARRLIDRLLSPKPPESWSAEN